MLFLTCWRCLSRLPVRKLPFYSITPPKIAAFTINPSFGVGKVRPQEKSQHGKTKPLERRSKNLRLKRKRVVTEKGKRPLPGERKAMRKRVVLMNSNALEVEGMQDATLELLVENQSRKQVAGIPGPIVDQLRAVGAFKATQSWRLFRRPGTLIRKATVQYARLFERLSGDGETFSVRRVLTGERGSGKTVTLLQAMTIAFLKNWVVINLPDALEIVIGHTDYAPLPQTSPTLYAQRSYVAKLLSSISRANPILETINLSSGPSSTFNTIPIPIPPSISLSRLALLGSEDRESAPQIFDLLMQELLLPGRPRLLLCLDGLAHVMTDSAYKSSAFKPVHAHELAIVDWFMGYLSGASPLPNGGMVLAATSQSNAPNVPTLNVALAELEAEEGRPSVSPQGGPDTIPTPYRPAVRNPFTRYDERVLSVLKWSPQGPRIERITGMSKEEVRGLLEYYARSGLLRQKVSEELVAEKWSMSGGGVVGELERAALHTIA